MYAALVRLLLRRSIRRLNAGDVGPMLSSYADDAVSIFPGDSSWSGEHRGRDAIEAFLQRFASIGLQFDAKEIVVSGWPWSAHIWVRFQDRAHGPDGTPVYENEGIIRAETRWGKIVRQETFEDTKKLAAFDEYLNTHERELAAAAARA